MGNLIKRCGAIIFLLILIAPVLAQPPVPQLRAAVTVAPPLVIDENGALTGFGIDLWNAVAAELKAKTSYQRLPDLQAVEQVLRQKKTDVVVSPMVLTLDRVREFDCSVPILQVGLQIMTRNEGGPLSASRPFWQELDILFSRTAFLWLGIASLLVLIPAHVVWLLDRNQEEGIISNPAYIPGIFQAIYWAFACLATQAEKMPHQWLARAVAIFWMFTGVAFVASYTAQLTSRLTVQQIRNAIEGPADLPGKEVGTIANTYAVDYLRARGVHVITFDQPDELFEALLEKRVDAVVWESPILHYYATHQGKGYVTLVGPEFNSALIAILMQLNSPLRRQIDIALLSLREKGIYQNLHRKWFGDL
jgi:polar amino acid transport system substrate-binding protein